MIYEKQISIKYKSDLLVSQAEILFITYFSTLIIQYTL